MDPARLRFWGVVVPIHLAAFATLYFGTYRLLEYAYSHAGAASARHQLDQAVREMPYMMPAGGAGRNPHVFGHLLAAHRRIGLRLYRANGGLIGPTDTPPDRDEMVHVHQLLTNEDQMNEVWIEADGGRQWVRGVVRLASGDACVPCHRPQRTLGAATMKIDFTEELSGVRSLLQFRVGLLLAVWVLVVAAVAFLVQATVRRSLRRLDADLAAAAAGRAGTDAEPDLALDPGAAKVHGRLREMLRRQRAREVEVASRLAHHDQLASLGQLAAGLAHEIKNPLAGIQGALEVLKDETSDKGTAGLYDEMMGELKRVHGILQRLLESGRPAPLRLARTDLAKLVSDTVELMRPALRRAHVELTAEVEEEIPHIPLDAAKIRQVLVNLMQNAAEAMGEMGGHVTVRTGASPDAGAVVAVEDDGPGIAPADQAHLFEPFFTTKFAGTGLGLVISKGLVEQHGGRLEVDSEPGRGTTFFVFLPASAATVTTAATDEVA